MFSFVFVFVFVFRISYVISKGNCVLQHYISQEVLVPWFANLTMTNDCIFAVLKILENEKYFVDRGYYGYFPHA